MYTATILYSFRIRARIVCTAPACHGIATAGAMAATRIVLRLNRPGGNDLRVPVKWYGEPSMADLEATCRRAIAAAAAAASGPGHFWLEDGPLLLADNDGDTVVLSHDRGWFFEALRSAEKDQMTTVSIYMYRSRDLRFVVRCGESREKRGATESKPKYT
jgi:hypothetical protein